MKSFIFGVLSLVITSTASAESRPNTISNNAEKKVEQNTQNQTAAKRQALLQEATIAFRETENAIKALNNGKKSDALSALERAAGKLELILARESTLALAPSGVSTAFFDLQTDLETAKKLREQAEEYLEDGQVQQARQILGTFASEKVISVANIPLATYPGAIKQAAKMVDENKFEDAKRVLQTALNTLVIKNTIIPLPVAVSEQLLKEAETLAAKKDRTADENKKLDDLLKEVRTKLEYAQILGYGTKKDFKGINDQLSKIEEQTKSGKYGDDFFAKIKLSISDLMMSFEKLKDKNTYSPSAKANS